jgi:hypothetical protein
MTSAVSESRYASILLRDPCRVFSAERYFPERKGKLYLHPEAAVRNREALLASVKNLEARRVFDSPTTARTVSRVT